MCWVFNRSCRQYNELRTGSEKYTVLNYYKKAVYSWVLLVGLEHFTDKQAHSARGKSSAINGCKSDSIVVRHLNECCENVSACCSWGIEEEKIARSCFFDQCRCVVDLLCGWKTKSKPFWSMIKVRWKVSNNEACLQLSCGKRQEKLAEELSYKFLLDRKWYK